eukprot:2684073-Pleurochrysis_carterae.AAC.1
MFWECVLSEQKQDTIWKARHDVEHSYRHSIWFAARMATATTLASRGCSRTGRTYSHPWCGDPLILQVASPNQTLMTSDTSHMKTVHVKSLRGKTSPGKEAV